MKYRQIIFIRLLLITQGFITFDSGQMVHDNKTTTFYCQNGRGVASTYKFKGSFENIPQIFTSLEYIEASPSTTKVFFNITSITQSNFKTTVLCKANQVLKLYINWIAIDDQRVEIINIFDSTHFGQNTIAHQNPNALKGVPSLICFSYGGAFFVNITIDEVTPTLVKYTVNNTGKLLDVSFQIFLSIEEGYTFIEGKNLTDDYGSSPIPFKENNWFFVPYVGFNFANTDWIRETKIYVTTNSTIQYSTTHFQTKTPNDIYAAWIAQVFTKQFVPMLIQRITTAQFNDCSSNIQFNTVQILELNKYFSSFGQTKLLLDPSITDLNVEIITTCQQNQKYEAYFNVCNSCSDSLKLRRISSDCQQMQNRLGYRFRMKQSGSDNYILNIVLSSSGVQIQQILINQKQTVFVLVDIQLQNE